MLQTVFMQIDSKIDVTLHIAHLQLRIQTSDFFKYDYKLYSNLLFDNDILQ